ncbi:toll/interleukin-1 receptor domain-containing protein, partial [Klebsiella pneumoniae]
ELTPALLGAIGESWASIIVFSKGYASSRWCLKELAEIMKKRKETGLGVYPIFYDVDPSDLRNQRNSVEEAFKKHETNKK